MIKEETLNLIINYLVNRPYQEVVSILANVQNDLKESQTQSQKETVEVAEE